MKDDLCEIKDQHFQNYTAFLHEKSRPPSKGGNTSALHIHTFFIDGEKYSFFARGSKQFAYKGETVSFLYRKKEVGEKTYFNVVMQTIVSKDKNGVEQKRGDRSYKQTLRTADARLPGSRREQR